MSHHLVLGAGAVGRTTTARLLTLGHEVTVATRRGTAVDGARPLSLDAADPAALTSAAAGVDVVYVLTNPPYHRWATHWPPIVDAVITAAHATGAGVVQMGNLYPYGRPGGPMSPDSPERPTEVKGAVRAEMWRRLRESHDAGHIRAAEVRASDYFGPGAGPAAHLGDRFFTPLLAGKAASIVGDPDASHAWAYLEDIAATLVAVGTSDDAWGRVWFAPHAAQEPAAAMAHRIGELTGAPARVRQLPPLLLRGLGLVSPMMRELGRISYQHTEPYLVDDSSAALLGLSSTPLDDALRSTIESYGRHVAVG